jgi:hypothetical protein
MVMTETDDKNLAIQRLKSRNCAVLFVLVGVVALFFTVTIVKLSPATKAAIVATPKATP